MKKIASIALSALACFGFVACDEFTMPNPPAQSNPDEAVFADTDLKLTSVVDGTISLPRLSEENLPVDLFDYELTNVPSARWLPTKNSPLRPNSAYRSTRNSAR